MAERDSTQCEFTNALMEARRELHEVMHHAGMLYALGEEDLPMGLFEENDVLRIESRALMENLRRLYDMITGDVLSGGGIPRTVGVRSAELQSGGGSMRGGSKPEIHDPIRMKNIDNAVSEIQGIAISLHRIGVDQINQLAEHEDAVYNGVTIKALAERVRALAEIAEIECRGGEPISEETRRMVMPNYIRKEAATA